jgi:hypothetical protein
MIDTGTCTLLTAFKSLLFACNLHLFGGICLLNVGFPVLELGLHVFHESAVIGDALHFDDVWPCRKFVSVLKILQNGTITSSPHLKAEMMSLMVTN